MKYCLNCHQKLSSKDSHFGLHLACFEMVFECRGKIEFEALTRKNSTSFDSDPTKHTSPHLTSYFGGNYQKYEGQIKGQSYIIKLSKQNYPELTAVEFVCNQMAKALGIRVPQPFCLLDFAEDGFGFVSKNFMANSLHNATLNHLYHYLPVGHARYTVEEIAKAIHQETNSLKDYHEFFKTVLFDALIGNHDRHGRNLALIETAQGKRLSPVYDNPSALGLEAGRFLKMQHEPRGKIWTSQSKEPKMKEYLVEIKRLKLLPLAKKFFNTIDLTQILSFVLEPHFLSKDMKAALKNLITRRYQEYHDFITTQKN